MRTVRTRIGSLLLVLAMLLTLLPATALAADGEIVNVDSADALVEAINAGNSGSTICLTKSITLDKTVTVDQPLTLTATEGVEIQVDGKLSTYFQLAAEGATLDGLTIRMTEDDANVTNLITMTANDTHVKNCVISGVYKDGDAAVSRAVAPNAGLTGWSITGNTISNLRQPGYIEGNGTISGNTVSGTRGWVICANYKPEVVDNTFENNIVDICIIENGAASNSFAGLAQTLSKNNNGAFVQDQMGKVEADDGTLIVDSSDSTYTLQAAIEAAGDGDTINVAAGTYDVGALTINKAVSLVGAGADKTTIKGTVSYQLSEAQKGANLSVSGITFKAADSTVQGLQFRGDKPNDGYNVKIAVTDCVFDGWTYALTMNSHANGYNMTVTGCTFTNCRYAVSYNYDNTTEGQKAVNTLTFGEGNTVTDGCFAVQKFNNAVSGDDVVNDTYETIDSFEKDEPSFTGNVVRVTTVEELNNAIASAKAGTTIVLAPGTYKTSLTIGNGITVTGLEGKAAETIIEGPATVGQTVTLNGGATLKNVTVTRDNSGSWKDNKNTTGVLFSQYLTAPTTLENCIITHNRNGVYLNNTGAGEGYAIIRNNQIVDNRTGINLTNNVNKTEITGNTINNNTTLGIVYYEATSGLGTDLDTVKLSGNTILGNWYGAINMKTLSDATTGSLSVGENTIVADGEKVEVSYAAAGEPGYDAQVPSWGGGEAAAPADAADVILTTSEGQDASAIANLVDYGSLEVESNVVKVTNAEELRNAVVDAKPGDVICVYPGNYNIAPAEAPTVQGQGNWYLPITANNVTIQGVDENGNVITDATKTQATIYSTTETKNSVWATQSLIAVFGNNVTITGLTIMPKVEVNKTIEVNSENFTITNCSIVPNDKVTGAPDNDAGSLYFAGDKGTVVVEGNYFQKMVLSFDSVDKADSILVENNTFDTPADGNMQMISNVSWSSPVTLEMADVTIRNNTFKNLPEGYKKLVLNRMGGAFILEDNELVKADGSADDRDITSMVSFDKKFFTDWDSFVESGTSVVIIEDGKTTTLAPTTEGGEFKTLTVSPASASTYVDSSVTLTAEMTGMDAAITWTVDSTNAAVKADGKTATFTASKTGTYKVTATADGVEAYAVITVTERGSSGSSGYAVTVEKSTNGTVTTSTSRATKGTKVTLTIKPNNGYVLDTLTVTGKDGKAVELTKVSDTKYTFTMPASAVTVKATFVDEGLPFTDVSGHWALDAIEYVYENGMMNGTTSTKFGPEAKLTRGMIVTILYRLEGEPTVSGSTFADVDPSLYYADPIAWAAKNGIVTGYDETTFGPENSITREQLAAILYRYASYKGYDVTKTADLSVYADADSVSAYAKDAMSWANAEGLITGVTTTTLNPKGTATRAQVATILMRFCENIAK